MPIEEIPPLTTPLAVRGRRDLAIVLDAFRPTHIDAWTARAVVVPAGVRGVPADAPQLLAGDPEGALVVRAVVVRHAGAVSGRRPLLGARRRRLDALIEADPPWVPLLGVVVERAAVTALWVRGDLDEVARRLSAPDWSAAVG